jgi:high-affinity K+ transport system ATPase subunit B
VSGEGKGVVVAVGKNSELGRITHEVHIQKTEKTFIQNAMTRLAATLAVVAIVVSVLIPLIGYFRGLQAQEMIVTWLALTFLMVPGQPPIIITMALALASFELARNNVVVKRLRGVEVLGQTTALMADKTGTITENTSGSSGQMAWPSLRKRPHKHSKRPYPSVYRYIRPIPLTWLFAPPWVPLTKAAGTPSSKRLEKTTPGGH